MTPATSEGERLSKRVMQLRACSRRDAEQYIEGGWVRVDGVVVQEPQHRVGAQTVTVDADASLLSLTPITLVMNKPPAWTDGLDALPAATAKRSPRVVNNVRSLLDTAHHSAHDRSELRVLKRHLSHLQASVPLEQGASGLVVFTQDWRMQRKLVEDMATMEHEFMLDVRGEVLPDMLRPILRALKDDRLRLPAAKISISSSKPASSTLRLAVKGAHPGLAAYVCELAQLEMLALRRIRLGRVSLGDLDLGTWRYLANAERF